jgi:uncharacterized membrane protein YfcA
MFEVFLQFWPIILSFFIVAILYSSVGFGGGSSYIAVLTLTSLAFTEVRFIALCCNIMVVSGNCIRYFKQHQLDIKKTLPLVLVSIPMSFLGGYLKINQQLFLVLLAFILLLASFVMWFSNYKPLKKHKNSNSKNLLFGASIGFLSGLVGIGGGIFLSPLLHITKWDIPKKIAATSSFFILVNSLAGIGGQQLSFDFVVNWQLILLLVITVFVGGQIGNRLSNSLLSAIQLKKATAILIALVSLRILWKIFT